MVNVNENAIKMIENCFSDYLMGKTKVDVLTDKLSKILSNYTIKGENKNFLVEVVNKNQKEHFFGARIFPIVDDLDKVASSLVMDKQNFKDLSTIWKKIDKWYIELDYQIFDKSNLLFTPQELTALIFHEIGHVIYSDKPIERFYRAYRDAYMKLKVADKASLQVLYTLFTIPLAISCMPRSWFKKDQLINEEIFADSTLSKLNYGEHLESALGKIVHAYGSIQDDDNMTDNKIKNSVKWCNLNIIDMTKRQKKLKDDLFYNSIKSESGYMKALSYKLLNILGVELRENYTGAVVESSIDLLLTDDFMSKYNSNFDIKIMGNLETRINATKESANRQIAMEAKSKLTIPSRYDIDAIFVEVDKISNHHDRIYVLDLIYNKIEELEKFKEIIEFDSSLKRKHFSNVEQMLEDLEKLRASVLAKRSFGGRYKLFVKVPEEYEG